MEHRPNYPKRRGSTSTNWWLLLALLFVVGLLAWQTYRLSNHSPLHNPNAESRPVTPRGNSGGMKKRKSSCINRSTNAWCT